jgi:hypothetical protein
MSKTARERATWSAMKARCSNPKLRCYKSYGGRGIKVCARWLESFANFYADMGPRPDGMSLDRIDNDGDYEPGNCRWATQLQQARNQRSNVVLEHNGERKTVSEWAQILGVPTTTIYSRHARGWPLGGIVTAERRLKPNELNAMKTHCKNGHEFTPENIIWQERGQGRKSRMCRICYQAYMREFYRARKENRA